MTLIIQRKIQTNKRYIEDLGDGISLEMVLVPGGTFVMGSSKDELDNYEDEQPQHVVTVPTFFMGRYPVTQEQWRQIAKMPQIEAELQADPSYFKSDQRPVEQVNWHEAVEFSERLKVKTGRKYQLPSEAQWEYACRGISSFPSAVTSEQLSEDVLIQEWNEKYNQPFHSGKTMTDELANYNSSVIYGQGIEGQYSKETTPINQFGVANNFGLSDMHGNVWEWCLDNWYENYEGHPTDFSALAEGDNSDRHTLRGGSWIADLKHCRSASRSSEKSGTRFNSLGFRVVCVP